MILSPTFNLAAIGMYFIILGKYVNNYKQIKLFMLIFLIFSLLNGLDILRKGFLLNDRDFGFAGVVYVDYVCIAMIITLVISLYKRKSNPWFYMALTAFLFVTLLMTRTRNTSISLLLTLICGLIYISINSTVFLLKKKSLIRTTILVFGILSIMFTAISKFSPDLSSRFSELVSKKQISVSEEQDFGKSSLITRLLVWYTCYNAFVEHPIIGIGTYSFPFDSKYYYTIPTMLYELFVEGLSPHITYLTVVTETGIVGITGFLIFLISSLLMGYRSLKLSENDHQRYYSLCIFLLQLYIAFSMLMSDAWLRDQCAMLWGIVLGISIANHNIVKTNY